MMTDKNEAPLAVSARPAMGVPTAKSGWTLTEKAKLTLWVIVLLAALTIIIQNWTVVTVKVLFLAALEMPLTLLLAATFLLGMIVGWLGPIIRAHRKRSAE